jgi:hypothetical protein
VRGLRNRQFARHEDFSRHADAGTIGNDTSLGR